MKIFQYIVFVMAGVLFFTSCEKSLEEINADPTRLTEVAMSLMLPEILGQAAYNQGTNPARVAGIITQQFVGVDAQQLQYNDYVLGEDAMNNYWRTGLYAGSLKSCQVLIDQATRDGATFYSGVAKIIMANEYGIATSMFGEIPFSEALQGVDNLKPAYDSQEQIYAGVLSLLDQGIADLASSTGYVSGDLIFSGDAAAWIATANALKARYSMQLSKRIGDKASNDALSAIANAFTSAAGQPVFNFGTAQTDNWPLAKFGVDRPGTLGIDDRFAQAMTDRNDPRISKYMEGAPGAWIYYNSPNSNLIWGRNNAPVPLISYAEVKFIEAEAIARTGGDASATLAEAITASMELNEVAADDYADYVAANGSVSGSVDEQVTKIMEEAYYGYFGHSFIQVWCNYRRTGVPALTPDPDASPGFDPSGIVPQRYLYVESETQTNAVNVQAARDRQGGGLLDNPVWAFE
ncbi:MAG: SusD/RagB family nutrient-binding outer membrane lipoprotein [Bacteroidetes bacterium]|nr:SusD/RagB family nutrient-binding outer membrane lipoprotein [Bacteroidota bacterium]